MGSWTKAASEYVEREVMNDEAFGKRLWVFDFDNTLVRTSSKVRVTKASGAELRLSSKEFALYVREEGDAFDYSDFRQALVEPRPIRWMTDILLTTYLVHGPKAVVLSARDVPQPIEGYLATLGLDGMETHVVGSLDDEAKATWIEQRIDRDGLQVVEFFDDTLSHVMAVRRLQQRRPDVRVSASHVAYNRSDSVWRR